MFNFTGKFASILAFVLVVLPLVSCGGGSSGSSGGTGTLGETGTLELGLTDAFSDDYQAVYVTVAEVQVKKQGQAEGESGWVTVVTPGQTYNLLELVNGTIATLGVGELGAGQYGQMRLILGEFPGSQETNILGDPHPLANYLIDSGDHTRELKVPSGYQSGIKIIKGFTIEASGATELILDFDAARSVVQAGKSGKYLLKPTIKVLETKENSVGGVVGDGVDPIGGAFISAQVYDSGAADPKDQVIVEAATVSSDTGAYKLFLPPDTYNIVVTKDGYLPACHEVEAQYYQEYGAAFSLTAETEIITISVNVSGLKTEEDSALLSIRQTIDCGSGDVTVEVASVPVANGAYAIALPAGAVYTAVASAAGETTQVSGDIEADTVLDFNFAL